jgi:hypothetical protein
MQARTHRDAVYFDCAVRQLRTYLGYLERDAARMLASVSGAAAGRTLPGSTPRKREPGRKRGAE